MKKLFFSALVAVVAIGGAYANEYSTEPNGGGSIFYCSGLLAPLCSAVYDGAYIYGTTIWVSPLPDKTIHYVN